MFLVEKRISPFLDDAWANRDVNVATIVAWAGVGPIVIGATTLAAGFGGTKLALPDIVRDRLLDRFPRQAETLANELGFSAECFTNREARFLAGLKNEHEMQRLIVAARELTLLQERQASLGRTNEIDPPSHA